MIKRERRREIRLERIKRQDKLMEMKEKSYFFPVVKPRKQVPRKAEKIVLEEQKQNDKISEETHSEVNSMLEEDSSPQQKIKRKASISNFLAGKRRPTIIIEEGTSLQNLHEGGSSKNSNKLDTETEKEGFRAVSSQILIQPSINNLANFLKTLNKKEMKEEQKKWGVKLNLKLLVET